jgi:hypothetical protein
VDPVRRSIRSFAAGIVVSLGSRLWFSASLPSAETVFDGGLILAGLAWLLGAYYGYRATRPGRRGGS